MAFEDLTKQERRRVNKLLREQNRRQPVVMTRVPAEECAGLPYSERATEVWRSARFMAVVYQSGDGAQRVSVNRTLIEEETGRWVDGITWDELQEIKAQIGRQDAWAVEIHPPTDEVVDVANMRHLWLLDEAPAYGWRRGVCLSRD